jgi:hypothetical protein
MFMANPLDEPLITKVPPRKIERPPITTFDIPERYKPKPIKPTFQTVYTDNAEMGFWEKTKLYGKLALLGVKLIPIFITIKGSLMFKDWKTTVTGIVKALFLTLAVFGVNTGHVTESLVLGLGYAIVDLVQAWYTPDKK